MTFPYEWRLSDGYPADGIKPHGLKVFGTFICGGGSTMGYKLAGFEHLGGVEIDKKVAEVYKANHAPKHLYCESIVDFNMRADLPSELYSLDLLDGSPPCSSFSMAGKREKHWGKNKKFREGQVKQRLDNLIFEYVATIKKLQPKVAILENVKGLLGGNAKIYAKRVKAEFEAAGYTVQVFLLNAAKMGVPQRRERVFFIGLRSDIKRAPLELRFNCKPIYYAEFMSPADDQKSTKHTLALAMASKSSDRYFHHVNQRVRNKNIGFTSALIRETMILPTISSGGQMCRAIDGSPLPKKDILCAGTFPQDYNFLGMKPKYLIGMSVPPVMTAQIANQIYKQWLA